MPRLKSRYDEILAIFIVQYDILKKYVHDENELLWFETTCAFTEYFM